MWGVNSQQCSILAAEKPDTEHERSLHSPKVTAWCEISVQVITGPFWYEDTEGAAVFITAKNAGHFEHVV